MRRIAALVLLGFLAACGSAPAPAPIAPPNYSAPRLADPDTICLRDLSAENAIFQPLGSFGEGHCSIDNPVRITAGTVPWNHPGILTCQMADTLVRFEATVVQPLARRLLGQPVRRMLNLGTYDCRTQRNETTEAALRLGTSRGGKLSEHAKGRAIDFAGVELADGSLITVKDNWRAGGAPQKFLHELARASCDSFNVVLTPNHDRLHQDHIHMDIGPSVLCGY